MRLYPYKTFTKLFPWALALLVWTGSALPVWAESPSLFLSFEQSVGYEDPNNDIAQANGGVLMVGTWYVGYVNGQYNFAVNNSQKSTLGLKINGLVARIPYDKWVFLVGVGSGEANMQGLDFINNKLDYSVVHIGRQMVGDLELFIGLNAASGNLEFWEFQGGGKVYVNAPVDLKVYTLGAGVAF